LLIKDTINKVKAATYNTKNTLALVLQSGFTTSVSIGL